MLVPPFHVVFSAEIEQRKMQGLEIFILQVLRRQTLCI